MTDSNVLLSDSFLNSFKHRKPPFGFNGLGELVYLRTYSRIKENGKNECWWETVERVVNGTFRIQKDWIESRRLGWDTRKARKSAQEMYERIFKMQFMPPGRGLWAMGSSITEERKLYAALNNCAFTSSASLKEEGAEPFCFLMDASMLGVGVGFDLKGAGTVKVKGPADKPLAIFQIPDSREGWVESVRRLINSFLDGSSPVEFDYTLIRKAGTPIKGFGGISSGPESLMACHKSLKKTLERNVGEPISQTCITDLMNQIGVCVVSGNVRRSAEIVFGDPNSDEYLKLKDYHWDTDKNKYVGSSAERSDYGWASNNSIFAELGMDYTKVAEQTAKNGEPGYAWLENMKGYSRMNNGMDHKDHRVAGGNPCFAGDTLIAVADGRGAVAIKQLAEEERDVAVYAIDPKTNKFEIKMARNPRKTRCDAELLNIEFEDGSCLKVTPDHKMLLLDGKTCTAAELQPGDSLPRFVKSQDKMVQTSKHYYWKVYTNALDAMTDKVMEHRLVAQFNQPNKWKEVYNTAQQNGWVKGGIVVHHKDYNPLNNSPSNLELMTFKDHAQLHAQADHTGVNNGMYGRRHSEETKGLIRDKVLQRCTDPDYRAKLSASQSVEDRAAASIRMVESKKEWDQAYYLEQARTTDLNTLWLDGKLYAVKDCDICGDEMVLSWGKRHVVFCSRSCANKKEDSVIKRAAGCRVAFENKQQDTLHLQIMQFKDLEQELRRKPMLKEWEARCKNKEIPFRIRNPSSDTSNPYALKSFKDLANRAEKYNHRVKRVSKIDKLEDVYNLTVDDLNTVVAITQLNHKSLTGIGLHQCLEQSLESKELCCLVETFPHNHDTVEDYLKTLKYAYMYAKTVTLCETHWAETNRVMLRNRRIGCSMSGIAQFIGKRGLGELKKWCIEGYGALERYDEVYSDWFAIPKSVKMTSIKPSGTVSLLAGATPGVHYPLSRFYIRRMRLGKTSDLIKPLIEAGYKVEPASEAPETSSVVEVPVDIGEGIRSEYEVSMWEKLQLAAFMQRYWADNQVSCTVSFKPEEAGQIKHALDFFQYQLKGISFLPLKEKKAYKQMPYEAISEEEYNKQVAKLKPLRLRHIENEQADVEKFCSNDTCTL